MSADDGATSVTQKPLLVLAKITDILDAFSLARPTLTLSEIQRATKLPTSTVQRLVTNMVAQGLLDRTGDQIRIGVKMAYWAAPAVKGVNVLSIITPVLREIRDIVGETTCFFREEQGYRVCVALAETRHALRRDMYVGKLLPLHAGSAGRVLLAWDDQLAERVLSQPLQPITGTTITSPQRLHELIQQTRKDGFAITTAEREDGSSGLAAPVFNSATELVGALAINGPTIRMPRQRCEEWVDLLLSHAEKLTRTLGGRHPT
jgi:DNA-binding IclR family transcriptional regulator